MIGTELWVLEMDLKYLDKDGDLFKISLTPQQISAMIEAGVTGYVLSETGILCSQYLVELGIIESESAASVAAAFGWFLGVAWAGYTAFYISGALIIVRCTYILNMALNNSEFDVIYSINGTSYSTMYTPA